MNPTNTVRVLVKDLRLGPRSPLLLWALVLPVVLTLLMQGVFGSLFDPSPRLGIVDEGSSEIAGAAADLDGIEVTYLDSRDELLSMVEAGDLDAGLILPAGFDTAVRAGRQPDLLFFVGGESLASNRIILSVTTLELVRDVGGAPAPVDVEVVALGDASVDISDRLVPLLVIFAVALSGTMVPAASLVQEKESKTLDALLVTPTTVGDVLVAKGLLGLLLALVTGVMTLALNNAFGDRPLALLVGLFLGALMMVEVGLILGAWSPDANTLFTTWKAGGIVLFFPVILYIWPTLPQWIAQIGPTYYFLQPIFEVSVSGAGLADVWFELMVAAAICAALVPAVAAMGRRMERRLSVGTPASAVGTPV